MAVNKVIYGGNTLVDLTGDTVTAADLADGVKATGADGNPIVGIMQKVTIDAELSTTSTNPVQNKVIAEAIANMGGGGSGGGGVSTSEVNTWTAKQIFNDITISGVKNFEYLLVNDDTITPTSSYTIWTFTDPVGTLNLDGLISKANNLLHFEVLFIGAGNSAPTLKIISTGNYEVICPTNTRCSNAFNMLHGVIMKDASGGSTDYLVFIKIDAFDYNWSDTTL